MRELTCEAPPRADAGLRPGERTHKLLLTQRPRWHEDTSGAPVAAPLGAFPSRPPHFTSLDSSGVLSVTAPPPCRYLTALDAALEFQQRFVVPDTWKTEVKEESSSSEDEDEDEEEEQEEDASGEEEEVEAEPAGALRCLWAKEMSRTLVLCLQEEVEPFPEERENFVQQLYKFMEDRGEPDWTGAGLSPSGRSGPAVTAASPAHLLFISAGTPINKRPVLGYRNLNLFKLYRLVHKLGGFDSVSAAVAPLRPATRVFLLPDAIILLEQIESGSVWKQVYQDLGIPILNSAAGYNVKCAYRKYADTPPPRRCGRKALLYFSSTSAAVRLFFHAGTCMDLRSTAPPPPSPSGWTSLSNKGEVPRGR